MRSSVAYLVSLLFAVSACGGGGGNDSPDARAVSDARDDVSVAHYDPPTQAGSGAAWGAVPYPSDLYLDGDGLLTLTSLPTGVGFQQDFVDMFLEALHSMDGAGVWSFAFFPIDGAVDPATLGGNVKIVRLPDLAEVPVDLVWRADLSAIVAVPKLGTLLDEDTRYAAYATTAATSTASGFWTPMVTRTCMSL